MGDKSNAYQKYYFSRQELSRARKFLEYILKEKLHRPAPLGKNKSLIQEAITISFIVTYSKPFTNNDGFGTLAFDRSKFSILHVEVHSKIVKLRNNVFAHMSYGYHNVREHQRFTMISSPLIFIPREDCIVLIEIIDKLLEMVEGNILRLKEFAPRYLWP